MANRNRRGPRLHSALGHANCRGAERAGPCNTYPRSLAPATRAARQFTRRDRPRLSARNKVVFKHHERGYAIHTSPNSPTPSWRSHPTTRSSQVDPTASRVCHGEVLNTLSMLFLACLAVLALARQRISPCPLFPMAAPVLSAAAIASFIYLIAVEPDVTTYASALIPLLVVAIPLLLPTRMTRTNCAAATGIPLSNHWHCGGFQYTLWYLMLCP